MSINFGTVQISQSLPNSTKRFRIDCRNNEFNDVSERKRINHIRLFICILRLLDKMKKIWPELKCLQKKLKVDAILIRRVRVNSFGTRYKIN